MDVDRDMLAAMTVSCVAYIDSARPCIAVDVDFDASVVLLAIGKLLKLALEDSDGLTRRSQSFHKFIVLTS